LGEALSKKPRISALARGNSAEMLGFFALMADGPAIGAKLELGFAQKPARMGSHNDNGMK
jgi:hypothetical protein